MNLVTSNRPRAWVLASVLSVSAVSLLAASATSCSGPPTTRASVDEDLGAVSLGLGAGPNLTLDTVSYSLTAPGFSRQGTLNLHQSTMLSGFIGGLPAATGYLISLAATLSDGVT